MLCRRHNAALATAVQSVVLLQVISRTVSQFQFPYPGAAGPMGPVQMAPSPFHGRMPGPVPMPFPMQHKMPMVVMPYYSKTSDKVQNRIKRKRPKHRKIRIDSSCSENDDDSESSSDEFDFRTKAKGTRRQVLTPVVSYVTKDGYVVYQKKVKKDKAKDWLEMGRRTRDSHETDEKDDDDEVKKFNKLQRSKKHYHHQKH